MPVAKCGQMKTRLWATDVWAVGRTLPFAGLIPRLSAGLLLTRELGLVHRPVVRCATGGTEPRRIGGSPAAARRSAPVGDGTGIEPRCHSGCDVNGGPAVQNPTTRLTRALRGSAGW